MKSVLKPEYRKEESDFGYCEHRFDFTEFKG